MKFVILAPGESMSQALADSLKGNHAIVVNDVYKLAPWADALAAQDREWWDVHPSARAFQGRKFSSNYITGIERVTDNAIANSSNSGVFALQVAKVLGATTIHLHGFDMHGLHYFGAHPKPLNNSRPDNFELFQGQFAFWRFTNPGMNVVNKTPGSALRTYRYE